MNCYEMASYANADDEAEEEDEELNSNIMLPTTSARISASANMWQGVQAEHPRIAAAS
ncbi:unnamed protein product [Rhodiola kirilowii]